MKYFITIVACALLLGCQATGKVTQEEPIKIGGMFALTSYGADWGSSERDGALLAIAQANEVGGVNEREIELLVEDTQTDPTTALTVYQKLTTVNNVKTIIGPTWEASAEVTTPKARDDNVLLITPSSFKTVSDLQAHTVFSTYPPYSYQIATIVPYAKEHGYTKVAYVYADEVFNTIMKNLFVAEAQRQHWETVGDYKTPLETKDYRGILLKLKQSDADLVYITLEKNHLGTFAKQAKELGVTTQLYGIDDTEDPYLLKNYAEAVDGILYPAPTVGKNHDVFIEAYTVAYGHPPLSSSAANAYDAANMIIEAMRHGASTSEQIGTYLHNQGTYHGASGDITFDQNGILKEREYKLKTIQNGSFVFI